MYLYLDWYMCEEDVWCDLNRVDLEHKYIKKLEGIYIVWYEQGDQVVVTTGYGNISEELKKHRQELAVQAFKKYTLKVSWAEAPRSKRKGIYSFLISTCKPKIVIEEIDVEHVQVNLPWEEDDE